MPIGYIVFPDWIRPAVISGLPIRWYGVMYLVAFGLTYLLTVHQLRDEDAPQISRELVANLFFWTIIGLIVGSRVFATTLYDTTGYYRGRPWLIFWPFDAEMRFTGLQGMSFHGGLVGGTLGFLLYCWIRRLPTLAMGDMVTAAVPLGYTFGRLGNFVNGELYGRISAAPWAVLFPGAAPVPYDNPAARAVADAVGLSAPAGAMLNLPRHPSQIYEALLEGVLLWLVLWFLVKPRNRVPGTVTAAYVIGYAIARFVAEYFRAPDPGLDFVIELGPTGNPRWLLQSALNITTGQVLSLIMLAAGLVMLGVVRALYRRRPRVETFDDSRDQTE